MPNPPGPRREPAARPLQPRGLDHDDRREIEQMTAGIADPALAVTLERLLTKDRLARGAREASRARPRERHDA
jgi:hypothetical protein